MLKVDLIAVGTKAPDWVEQGMAQYVNRMRGQCRFSLQEVKTSDRNKKQSIEKHQQQEAERLASKIDESAHLVALDRAGKNWSTEQLAKRIQTWSQAPGHVQLIVGGPDGLDASLVRRASDVWSLSNLTFPHFLVRVLLSEQIYRAMMLNANHPYHK